MRPFTISPTLLSRTETAQTLGLSERSIDYLVAENRIHSVKQGARRLFPRADVLAFAEQSHRGRISKKGH